MPDDSGTIQGRFWAELSDGQALKLYAFGNSSYIKAMNCNDMFLEILYHVLN